MTILLILMLYSSITLRHVAKMLSPDFLNWFLALGLGYLAGSIPFGLLLAKASGQGDIRNIGSGNIGATNVLRTGRKDIAAITLILDAAKAGLTGWIIQNWLGLPFGYVAAAAALIGHCYPAWLKFKGGKGVATFFGGLFALVWPIGVLAAVIWLATAIVTKYSSLGALIACVVCTIASIIFLPQGPGVMVGVMSAVILWRHRENIDRLRRGEESKIGQKG
ncbi:MAG: glycerol-3-phosphate 1-O-acyltransferase PlsY [Litorimonas sp.]